VITVYDDDDLHISVYISLVLLGNQSLTKVILPVNLYRRKKIGGRKGHWRINIVLSRFPSHDRHHDILHYVLRRRRWKRRRSGCNNRYNIFLPPETNTREGNFIVFSNVPTVRKYYYCVSHFPNRRRSFFSPISRTVDTNDLHAALPHRN